MFKKIVKRDGKIVNFNPDKITEAIAKAGLATEEFKAEMKSRHEELVALNSKASNLFKQIDNDLKDLWEEC